MIGKQIAFNYSCARCACAMTSMELIMNMNNMNRFVWGFQPGTKVRRLQVFFVLKRSYFYSKRGHFEHHAL